VTGPLRVVRGVTLGLAMVLLTAAAHAAAHRQLPDAGALTLLVPISVGLSIIGMDRPRGFLWFLLYALGIQALLHVLLVTISAHSAHHSSLLPDSTMVITHILAAGMLAILLARGDAVLLRWVSYVRTVLFNSLQTPKLVGSQGAVNLDFHASNILPLAVENAIARRGPPESRQ